MLLVQFLLANLACGCLQLCTTVSFCSSSVCMEAPDISQAFSVETPVFNSEASIHHYGRDLELFPGMWTYKQSARPSPHTLPCKLLCHVLAGAPHSVCPLCWQCSWVWLSLGHLNVLHLLMKSCWLLVGSLPSVMFPWLQKLPYNPQSCTKPLTLPLPLLRASLWEPRRIAGSIYFVCSVIEGTGLALMRQCTSPSLYPNLPGLPIPSKAETMLHTRLGSP